MGTNNLKITIANSVAEAPSYVGTDIGASNLHSAVIVKKGTSSGKPTVDLRFTDGDGKEHVAMITGAILVSLAAAIEGAQ